MRLPSARNRSSACRVVIRTRRNVEVVGVDHPDLPDVDYAAAGDMLPGPHATLAGPTFEEWLDTRP
ncbi:MULTISPECIES: hypothetical protein [Saccharothrix]|uniref:hypothetical protein n=1 Tax=Saccharothrix TaxID=2071 RepID=UPI0018EA0E24|nr:hypothetical protein [Saccharothrix sp. CB00851]